MNTAAEVASVGLRQRSALLAADLGVAPCATAVTGASREGWQIMLLNSKSAGLSDEVSAALAPYRDRLAAAHELGRQHLHDLAMEQCMMALARCAANGDSVGYAYTVLTMGDVHLSDHRLTDGIRELQAAISLLRVLGPDHRLALACAYRLRGEANARLDSYDTAESDLQTAYNIVESLLIDHRNAGRLHLIDSVADMRREIRQKLDGVDHARRAELRRIGRFTSSRSSSSDRAVSERSDLIPFLMQD